MHVEDPTDRNSVNIVMRTLAQVPAMPPHTTITKKNTRIIAADAGGRQFDGHRWQQIMQVNSLGPGRVFFSLLVADCFVCPFPGRIFLVVGLV